MEQGRGLEREPAEGAGAVVVEEGAAELGDGEGALAEAAVPSPGVGLLGALLCSYTCACCY